MSLIGVSYALIDLIENFDLPSLKNWNIIETGGMKGRKKNLLEKSYTKSCKEVLKQKIYTVNTA